MTERVPVSMRPASRQVADEAVHVVGLVVNDAEQLEHLGRVQNPRGVEHGGGRAP